MTVTLMGGKLVPVVDYMQASLAVRDDLFGKAVGSNEWAGTGAGKVYVDGVQVAHVSYNGRVWKGVNTGKLGQEEIVLVPTY